MTLLAAGLLLAPAAGVTAGGNITTYRAPTRFTPGWSQADIPHEISYLDGEVHSAPASTSIRPAIDALAAARRVDAQFSGHSYEQGAEVALRIVWFEKEFLAQLPAASSQIQPGERRLLYVVLQHDHIPGGGGRFVANQASLPPRPPQPSCGVLSFVDASTGELVFYGSPVVCGRPG
ncbi:hypothetical protein F4553_004774 [Allocatelliglobosispora scoriae]|uniref:Uncharacterized protein n=1 Tax=Allocatelliglobosispora scoriae TaxID=643052 RepID=A0A841BUN8_9ACTN|nr:hypothetical protein [Allocatelliglobosispora scoriae]MBB5871395.1 hypothetical protein [Allocatelliglobosispora scoriae]